MWTLTWYVALGSALGGATRFLLGGLLQRSLATTFPIATLAINISGSLLLGFLLQYSLTSTPLRPEVRFLLTTGFCGGYTTFSTFSYETLVLLESGERGRAALYMGASLFLSLLAAYAGSAMARALATLRAAR